MSLPPRTWHGRHVLRALALGLLMQEQGAAASGALEFPDLGTEQFGRGGAWVARATRPAAAFYNPAGLVTQSTSVSLDAHLVWTKTCLSRFTPNFDRETVSGGGPTLVYPESVCNANSDTPFVNPSIAMAFRLGDKWAIGISLAGPNSPGPPTYPDVVMGNRLRDGAEVKVPSPTRYLLLRQKGVLAFPTFSVSHELVPDVRIGVGFVWGVAALDVSTMTVASSGGATSDTYGKDVRGLVHATDLFIPGGVFGLLYSPSPSVDIGVWGRFSDAIRASGDLSIKGFAYSSTGTPNAPWAYACGNPGQKSCTEAPGSLTVTAPISAEAKVGLRYHQPRDPIAATARSTEAQVDGNSAASAAAERKTRDPLSQDVFDLELDLTYAYNSDWRNTEVRTTSPETPVLIGWASNATVAENSDIPRRLRDVVGFRLGGDWSAIPERLAVRGGMFYETRAQDPKYLNVDIVPAARFGLTAGATVRLGSLDLLVAVGHVFGQRLDNHGQGEIYAETGTAPNYRTDHAVNSGSVRQEISVASLGATYSF